LRPFNAANPSVRIRPFQSGDAQAIYAAVQESAAQTSPWLPELNENLSLDEIQAWLGSQARAWSEGSAYNFAIVAGQPDRLLGGCGLTQINRRHGFANLFYWVRSSRTGQGAATAAVLLLARFGFDTLALQRIEIVVAVENPASLRVAEKAGALREGVLRNRIRAGEAVYDAVMFSLVPGEVDHF
jgi:RimJ/RimL family protein N-acetyltransferase